MQAPTAVLCRDLFLGLRSQLTSTSQKVPAPRESAATVAPGPVRPAGAGLLGWRGWEILGSVGFALAATAGAQLGPTAPAYHFAASVTVGAAAETGIATVKIAGTGSLGALQILTQGIPNQDFTLAAGGSCSVGTAYFAGQTCTVALSFQPKFPGLRQGAAVLLASNGSVLGCELLNATGVGATGVFVPGVISTVAGNGQWIYRGDGGQATGSTLFLPMGGALDAAGNLFISDSNNQRIRKVNGATQIISTVAGNGTPGFGGDGGLATSAMLDTPADVKLDGAGNMYIADSANHAVRMVNAATGIIWTIAGTGGQVGYSGDGGQATQATLGSPSGLAFDGDHTLYISDPANNAVRKVDLSTGIITTVAGTGTAGFAGDGGPAIAGLLDYPWEIALGGDGSLYIADLSNNRIRKVNPAGTISTVVGTGVRGYDGDLGLATKAELNVPAGVAMDVAGNLYVADSGNSLVRKVGAVTGIIQTIAGTTSPTPSGDGGPANNALLDGPYALFLDGPENLYIADMFHQTIREVSSDLTAFTYPVMRVGGVSAPQPQTFENDGNLALNFTAFDLVSNSALDSASTTCAVSSAVAVNATCVLGVEFAPTTTGASVTGSISLVSNAANTPGVIDLSGQVLSVNPTTISLTSSANPATLGAAVTFTAVVSNSVTPAPTGAVKFLDGTTQIGTGTLTASAVATFPTATLTSGSHTITAVYSGDPLNAAATSAALTETVKQPTTTALTGNPNPSMAAAAVTFTATVAGPAGSTVIPTGTVVFFDGATTLGPGTLNASGVATITLSTLSAGQHNITANYGGDTPDLASQSTVLVETVAKAPTTTVLATSNATVYAGSSVTFTAVASRADGVIPTGTFSFQNGPTAIGTANLDATGTATFATTALAVGIHSITAVYAGDANDLPSTSAIVTETVQQIATSTTLAANNNPTPAGAVLQLTATLAATTLNSGGTAVTTGGAFSGTVTFAEGGTTLGTGTVSAAGVATLSISTLSVGAQAITATFGGDTNYMGSASTPLLDTVALATTSTTLASNLTPSIAGKPVPLTATVAGNGGVATGTITFLDGGISIGTGTLNALGIATLTTSALAVGQHNLTAAYLGDPKDSTSTSTALIQTVQAATTSVALNTSSNPATAGLAVTFTAVVTGNGATPAGTITFKDGSTVLGTAALSVSGSASMTTKTLAVGAHPVTAVYSGDANDSTSTSAVTSEVVQLATTTTALAATPNPANQGTAVNLTVTVIGNGVTPTGTVSFYDGSAAIGSGTLNTAGAATLSLTTLTVGPHSLTAVYGSDAFNSGSTSPAVSESILPTTTSSLSANHNPAFAGGVLIFTAVVTGGSTAPTGTVSFHDGATLLGTGAVNGAGVATLSLTTLAIGQHNITAVYSGDAANGTDTSPVLVEIIEQATTQTALTASANGLTVGAALTLTATLGGNGGTPGGSATFMDGATVLGTGVVNAAGVAAVTLSTLAPGQHTLTAVYTGDTADLGSTSSPVQLTVQQATPAVAVGSGANPSLGGVTVTFTASFSGAAGTPTGTVAWRDGTTMLGSSALGSAGTASFPAAGLAIGTHPIAATYSGDTNNAGATSAVLSQVVQQGASSIALASSANPSLFGANVTFTVNLTVTGSAATGLVTFSDGATVLGSSPVNAGSAQFNTAALAIGAHPITAVFNGDANHAASPAASLSQQVLQAGAVTLGSSVNPSIALTSITFTATIAAPQGVAATGSVTFKDGAAAIGTSTVNAAGVATFSLATLAVGQHSIVAVYGGDANNQASSSSTLAETVQTAGTSVTLISSANPSLAGAPLTLTSTVVGKGGAVTGVVTFEDGTIALGAASINPSGVATFIVSGLAPGLHSIVAVYGGDANNLSSSSPVLAQSVRQTTTVSLSSNQNPSLTPDPVTFTAVVSNGGSLRPSGTVTFTDGTTALGTATLDVSGTATLTAASMTAGQHAIHATYSGDALNLAGSSATLTQSVRLRPTTNLLTASSTSLTGGQQVTLISVVRFSGPVTPTGTVTFLSDGTTLGTSALDSTGVATLTVNLLSSAPTVTAIYSGDSIYSTSTSPVTTITVAKPTQFTMQMNPAAMTMQSQQHGTATLTLTSLNNFSDTLDLGCLGLPFAATCTFTKDQVALTADGTQTMQVVIDTGSPLTAGSEAKLERSSARSLAAMAFLPGGLLLGLLFWKAGRRMRSGLGGLLTVLLLAGLSTALSGCGGLQINGTPAGTYVFQVTASGSGTGVTQSMNMTLTVTP
jgi:large repetitive protein